MTARTWTDRDTETLCTWLVADPQLWQQMGFPQMPSRQDVDDLIAEYRAGEPTRAVVRAVESNGELAGFVSIRPRLGSVGAVHLTVAPSHRGAGQLVGACGIAVARALGLKTLVAAAMTGRTTRAQTRWLAALGFTPRQTWQLEL